MSAKKPPGRKEGKVDTERGKRIAALIETGQHSVSQLARDVGVDRSAIYRWMDGKPISDSAIGPLIEALGVSRSYLLTGKDDPREQQLDRIEAAVNEILDHRAAPGQSDADLRERLDRLAAEAESRHSELMSKLSAAQSELEQLRKREQQPERDRAAGGS